MADPRSQGPGPGRQKSANHSPLMKLLVGRGTGDVVNRCPFGCTDEQLDESGYCGHLVGFYNGGQTFEPRVQQLDNKRKPTGRIIVCGEMRQPMKRGYRLDKITTSARVYSPQLVEDLVPKRSAFAKGVAEIMAQEKELAEFAEKIRNPVLEGEWDDSVYDRPFEAVKPTPAATAPVK